jgi:hypothetical protein
VKRAPIADDPRIAVLFAVPPERFTAARDALLRELSASRDPAAAAVRRLRRPTRRVWLLNRLARERRAEVRALLEAGERVRRAHAATLRGEPAAGLRAADDALGRRLDALGRAAAGLLAREGHPAGRAVLDELQGDLRAAAVGGADDARALRAGALGRPPRAAGEDPFGLALAPRRAGAAPRRGARRRAEGELRRARRVLAAAEEELARREAAASRAEEGARRLRALAAGAAQRVRAAREQALRAEAALHSPA